MLMFTLLSTAYWTKSHKINSDISTGVVIKCNTPIVDTFASRLIHIIRNTRRKAIA